MFPAAQPPWLAVLAVEYSGRKLNRVAVQSAIEVFMKPFLAEASMNPVFPVLRLARCGLGGPVGTPFVWMNAKLIGSMQLLLHTLKSAWHSSESIVSAA